MNSSDILGYEQSCTIINRCHLYQSFSHYSWLHFMSCWWYKSLMSATFSTKIDGYATIAVPLIQRIHFLILRVKHSYVPMTLILSYFLLTSSVKRALFFDLDGTTYEHYRCCICKKSIWASYLFHARVICHATDRNLFDLYILSCRMKHIH